MGEWNEWLCETGAVEEECRLSARIMKGVKGGSRPLLPELSTQTLALRFEPHPDAKSDPGSE